MIEIDGAQGEGGGQVLRSALTLSILTDQPFHIVNIRARRSKPGLAAQHLKSIDAAATISKAEVQGAHLGSRELSFKPGGLRSGRYKFEVGTAGATTLILQTILLPLSRTSSASTVIITGGTHVPASPCYHYIEMNWLPCLREIGMDATLSLGQAGFFPRGGGRIQATIRPSPHLRTLNLFQRGKMINLSGISAVANLPRSIAERQRRQALLRIKNLPALGNHIEPQIKIVELPSPVKGTLLLLLAEFENGRACYFSLGELGKPAEKVADEAVDRLEEFLESDGAIDQYLADQLLLPLSFADGVSTLRTSRVTSHLMTNAEILQLFLPVKIAIEGEIGETGIVRIVPQGSKES
jgi:RNA 3'-terminal phosphate cyclase (ATP)